MELKAFVSTALQQIVEGVAEAQAAVHKHGAEVNPAGLARSNVSSGWEKNALLDQKTNTFAQLVQFDVAVTVEEGTATNAKIGVLGGIMNLGAGGQSANKEIAITRIQFNVPVLLSTSKVGEMPPDYTIG